MRNLTAISAIVLAAVANAAPLAAAPAGEIECIIKDWTEAQYADVYAGLFNKSGPPSAAEQRGTGLLTGRITECAQANHWSEGAISAAMSYSSAQIFVQIVGNQIAREGGSTAVLDHHFSANRAEMIGLTEIPQIDVLQLGPRLVEEGFAPANSPAYKSVSIYFCFLALREQARELFLEHDS